MTRKEEMAEKIYDSITQKILPLGDGVILCPAHGAGSVCGGEIADHPFTTVGYEKATNPFIRNGKGCVRLRTENRIPLPCPPISAPWNGTTVMARPCCTLPRSFARSRFLSWNISGKTGARSLISGHPRVLPAAISPAASRSGAAGSRPLPGWFLNYDDPIVIIDDFNQNLEQVTRQLFRMGYDNIAGILAGGIAAWYKSAGEIGTIGTCSVQELKEQLDRSTPFLLDVRDIRNRRAIGLYPQFTPYLCRRTSRSSRGNPGRMNRLFVYCDAGYKGSLAASILAQHHYREVTNVLGGMTAWKQAGFRIEH